MRALRTPALGSLTVLALLSACAPPDDGTATPPAGRTAILSRAAASSAPTLPTPVAPTVVPPTAMLTVAPPPAPLPSPPTRDAVSGWSCEAIVQAVNGAAARCVPTGSAQLKAQAVSVAEHTVGLTDADQRVYVQSGMSPADTYLVAMHERGHQELIQRCVTWICGDALVDRLHTTRQSWNDGPYFLRVAEIAASTWARCHGADNARYGYRLSCADLQAAFDLERSARADHFHTQHAYDQAWASYRAAYERYRTAGGTAPAAVPSP